MPLANFDRIILALNMAHQRSIKNYLINPVAQLRLASVSLISLFLFTISCMFILWTGLSGLVDALVILSDIPIQVRQVVSGEVTRTLVYLGLTFLIYFLFTVSLVIYESHKIVGAAYAIHRFVKNSLLEKKYSDRLILRKKDFLTDLGSSVNLLAEHLEKQEQANQQSPPKS